MGQCDSCLRRCFGSAKRNYFRTHYKERNYSIEFENLMNEDDLQDEMQRPLTDYEKELLTTKQYSAILSEQEQIDRALELEIARQEEEIRAEEEAFYEAKREAARIAKLQRDKDRNAKSKLMAKKSWLGDENDWQVSGSDDDFETFLANVKARSLASRERLGSGDGQSTVSSASKEKSHDASSLELEWDHQGDVTAPIVSQPSSEMFSNSTNQSRDVSHDTEQLLRIDKKLYKERGSS